MTRTRTSIEIAADGTPLRVFHRNQGSVWDHPVDDVMFKTTGRHGAVLSRPCPICSRDTRETNGRSPEPRERPGTASSAEGAA